MPIVAFEGLKGVGKSTLAKAFARSVGGTCIADLEMHPAWGSERRAVDKGDDLVARFEFFKELNRQRLLMAQQISNNKRYAVLSSTAIQTVATHSALGLSMKGQYSQSWARPDVTFLIDVPEDERAVRLQRSDSGELMFDNKWDELLHERQAAVREQFASFDLPQLDGRLAVGALVQEVHDRLAL